MSPGVNLLLRASLENEVRDYRREVLAVSSAPASFFREVNWFVRGSKYTDNTWDSQLDVGLFAGVDTLAGALVKLKTPSGIQRVLTNTNFVSGDYVATGASAGLWGNGSTKWANTGFPQNTIAVGNRHLGAYTTFRANLGGTGSGLFAVLLGADGPSGAFNGFGLNNQSPASVLRYYCGATDQGPNKTSATTGHYVGTQTAATTGNIYTNGGGVVSAAVTGYTPTANAVGIYCLLRAGSPILYSNERLTFYHIGTGLTAGQVASLSARVNTLMTAFGCNTY